MLETVYTLQGLSFINPEQFFAKKKRRKKELELSKTELVSKKNKIKQRSVPEQWLTDELLGNWIWWTCPRQLAANRFYLKMTETYGKYIGFLSRTCVSLPDG